MDGTPRNKLLRDELFDGPGSGLDADTLDGVHYQAIKDQIDEIGRKLAALTIRIERLERK